MLKPVPRLTLWTLTFLLLLAPAGSPAGPAGDPPLRFEHLTTDDGLSDLTVNAILQSRDGYIWIGTRDGLNRYDGRSFLVFRNDPHDSASLPGNNVWDIAEDPDGFIWVATSEGLARLDPDRGTFRSFHHAPADPAGITDDDVFCVYVDRSGTLWAGTDNAGVNRLARGESRFTRFRHSATDPNSISSDAIQQITEDRDGNLWVATSHDGLNLFESARGTWKHVRSVRGRVETIASDDVWNICAAPDGALCVGFERGGLDILDVRSGRAKHIPALMNDHGVAPFAFDSASVWFGTQGQGIGRIDRSSGRVTRYAADRRDPHSLSDDYSVSLYRDRSRCLWVGTGNGLNKAGIPDSRFHTVSLADVGVRRPGASEVSALLASRGGTLWMGTDDGLVRSPPSAGVRTPFLEGKSIRALCEDMNGSIWIGCDGGLFFLDAPGHVARPAGGIPKCEIRSLTSDSSGQIWIGSSAGLIEYSPGRRAAKVWTPVRGDTTSLSSLSINAVTRGPGRTIWVGGKGGLDAFDPLTGTCARILSLPGGADIHFPVTCLLADGEEIWFGTAKGLGLYRIGGREIETYFRKDGLRDAFIRSVAKDATGDLWVATRSGLSRFQGRPQPGRRSRFVDFNAGIDFPIVSFTAGACARNRSGHVLFGGTGGCVAVLDETDRPVIPGVVITAVRTSLRDIQIPGMLSSVKFGEREPAFSVEFAVLDFVDPQRNAYECMLEGYDHTWVQPGNLPAMKYMNLPAGEYLFRVRGANSEGVWNEAGASVRITIVPPLWRRPWFLALVVVVLGGLGGWTIRSRVHRLLEIERLRSRIATDLHDDIGANLTRITVFSDVARREFRPLRRGTKRTKLDSLLDDIGILSRETVDSMSDIVWAVEPLNDTFEQLLLRMKTHAARFLDVQNIDFGIEIEAGIGNLRLPLDFRRNFFLIFKESLSNIVRHSRARTVTIGVRRRGGDLVMIITDDGIGLPEDLPKAGNGLRNMARRAVLLGGAVTFSPTTNDGRGCTVTLITRIP